MFSFYDYDFENYTLVEEGKDGFVYENYIDFSRFRHDYEEELLLDAGVDIPFGRVISRDEFDNIFSHDSGLLDFDLLNLLKEKLFGENIDSDQKINANFIERDTELANAIVNNIFDNYGVPNGYVYEKELPDDLKYWNYQNYDEDLYEIFRKHPIKLVDYENNIRRIYEMVDRQEDELSKKLLILSSLIFTETMHKSVIISKLSKQSSYDSIYSRNYKNKVKNSLNSNITARNDWFERLYKVKSPNQYWNSLRNHLAHGIDEVDIVEDMILYKKVNNDELIAIDINVLRKALLKFGDEIKVIIDNSVDD